MKQSGYTLLLGLFALLSVSGIWVVSNAVSSRSSHADYSMELQLAKQALISYSVNYIDHYGVQGAGVGHLPCPDTDKPTQTATDPWAHDGPNPPCGKHTVAVGWLPRHVDTASGRYHFHTRNRQRLWYAVSDEFVNNPVNRVVNPATVGRIAVRSHNNIVAVLTAPALDTTSVEPKVWWEDHKHQPSPIAFTVIRTQDIIEPAKRRVASWLLSRVNSAKAEPPCALSAELELLHWLSRKPSGSDCEAHKQALKSEFVVFDGAPYARHWFIRNGWFNYIRFEFDSACFQELLGGCKFSADPRPTGAQHIVISLKESE